MRRFGGQHHRVHIFRAFALVLTVAFAGCAAYDDAAFADASEFGSHAGPAGYLIGEWAALEDPNDMIFFRPDPFEDNGGRTGGIGGFDKYTVVSNPVWGGRVKVRFESSGEEVDPVVGTIRIRNKGQSLVLDMPELRENRIYRRTR